MDIQSGGRSPAKPDDFIPIFGQKNTNVLEVFVSCHPSKLKYNPWLF
jgi:hypothetical protein